MRKLIVAAALGLALAGASFAPVREAVTAIHAETTWTVLARLIEAPAAHASDFWN